MLRMSSSSLCSVWLGGPQLLVLSHPAVSPQAHISFSSIVFDRISYKEIVQKEMKLLYISQVWFHCERLETEVKCQNFSLSFQAYSTVLLTKGTLVYSRSLKVLLSHDWNTTLTNQQLPSAQHSPFYLLDLWIWWRCIQYLCFCEWFHSICTIECKVHSCCSMTRYPPF